MSVDISHESLELDDVSRRFADATNTLTLVTEQLHVLAQAGKRAKESTDSLAKTSESVGGFAVAAHEAASALEAATALARDAFERATVLFSGREIEQLQGAVGHVSSQLDAGFQAVRSQVEGIIEQQQSDLRRDLEATKKELERIKAALSWRQKRKLGV